MAGVDVEAVHARIVASVVRHARDAAPEECCGILLGRHGEHATSILDTHRAKNVADRRDVRFTIDPADHFEAIRDARRRGLEVVGFYHSHPRSPARPSETDRAEAAYPGQLCLIVGLKEEPPEVRLFRVVDGNFLPVALVTAPG